jgi:hypothetical protein
LSDENITREYCHECEDLILVQAFQECNVGTCITSIALNWDGSWCTTQIVLALEYQCIEDGIGWEEHNEDDTL